MPSDSQDPGAIWQGPPYSKHSQPPAQTPATRSTRPSPLYTQQQAAYFSSGVRPSAADDDAEDLAAPGDAFDEQDPADDPAPSRAELFKQLNHYLLLFVVPLLLAGLTCLIVLPLVATHQAKLPPEGLWPITLVILAVAIAQGAAIYYSGSDSGMLASSILAGFFLFALIACFTLFGSLPGFLLLIVILAALLLLARRCIHPVPDGYVDIVAVAKKYNRTLYPGFNITLPWEKVLTQLNVEETQWVCPLQTISLSREEDVILRALVSYQLQPEDAHLVMTVHDWENSLRELIITTLQTTAMLFQPADFIAWPHGLQEQHAAQMASPHNDDFIASLERRNHINTYLFQNIRDKVALWGVQINWVSIRDVEFAPHSIVTVYKQQAHEEDDYAPDAVATNSSTPPSTLVATPSTPAMPPPPASQPKTDPAPATALQQSQLPTQPDILPQNQLPKEEFLIRVYKEVQDGNITDPETIRDFAAKFEAIAKDYQASQNVSFDAARAALNLYDQARKYEEQSANA